MWLASLCGGRDSGRTAVFALATLVLEIPEQHVNIVSKASGTPCNLELLELLQALDWHLRESSVRNFTGQDVYIFVCVVFVRIRRLRKSRQ